jgi:hypothetical protein
VVLELREQDLVAAGEPGGEDVRHQIDPLGAATDEKMTCPRE